MSKGRNNRFFTSTKAVWDNLGQSIFVGTRLKNNLLALTFVSIFCALLGLTLIAINLFSGSKPMFLRLLMSFVTLFSGIGCAYCSWVLKNRNAAIIIPTLFSILICTVYAFTGYAEGTGILWSLLIPIGMCYFVGVKCGILVSVYYCILYCVICYSPLGANLSRYYTSAFMIRFPIAYISLSVFTAISMIQYHRSALLEIEYTDRLSREVARQTAVAEERAARIQQMSYQTIQTLANAIDAKDPYTRGHSIRVSQYAVKIAEKLGMDEERIQNLHYAALLHDIGKIGVPDSILNNPKHLTDVEFDIIRSHTTMGSDILRGKMMIEKAEEVARSHHERYDGTGYPDGLKGNEIPEEARIVAVADAFDAMNSNRVYRRAYSREYILHELKECSGTQFDPACADILISLWNSGELDDILSIDSPENTEKENLEASSALLQEVMAAFAAQNGMEEIDLVTGIMSRSSGEAAIAKAMQECSGGFAFFDMDNLKKINDTSGHKAGDKVLKLVGDTLQDNSENALCCRLGGDEFLFFLKNATQQEAEKRVRAILAGFEQKKGDDPEITPASLSAGIVMTTPDDTYIKAYSRADKALYHVKQNGKNGFSFYNEEEDSLTVERVDMDRLVAGIHRSGSYEGAMDVEYRQFAKLYEFIANLEKRFSHPFRLVMITLEAEKGEPSYIEELEKAMYYMEQSIRQAVRNVDVVTRYSRRQFLIILVGTDPEGVRIAVDRIFRGYYMMNGSGAFTPSWSMADPQAGTGKPGQTAQ